MNRPDWMWNEMQQVGTDYADLAQVEAYDNRMGSFRNVDAENADMLHVLNLAVGLTVLEIGCGTGRFARAAAKAGMNVTAIDVSPIMLEYVKKKAADEGTEIQTQHSGFLTMDLPEASFNAAVSGAALHHLPDAWKAVALGNIARVLKCGGQFILRDVVFAPKPGEAPEKAMERFPDAFPTMRMEAARHVAQEFSTYDWIMEGLLKRAGFQILTVDNPSEGFFVYHCQKTN